MTVVEGFLAAAHGTRELRIPNERAVHHVMGRGDRREPIFQDAQDCETFLETFGQGCVRTGWAGVCLCRMPYHFPSLAELAGGMGLEHYGEERWEREVEEAEGIVRGELRKPGWEEENCGSTPKGHKVKVRVALRLRAETTVTPGWVAERLKMGSHSNLSNLVYGGDERLGRLTGGFNTGWKGRSARSLGFCRFCKEICVSGFCFGFCCCDFPRSHAR